MSTPLALTGAELELRYPRPEDAPALFSLASDPEVTRFFSWGPYRSEAQASEWLALLPARRETGEALELAVLDARAGLIGITMLAEPSKRDRRCVVGTWLGREHWGTGANRRTKALLARFAFDTLGVERLGAYADVRNARSQVALERLGFEREGVLRAFHRHGAEPRDVASYALLREDWERSPLADVQVQVRGDPPPAFKLRG